MAFVTTEESNPSFTDPHRRANGLGEKLLNTNIRRYISVNNDSISFCHFIGLLLALFVI
jgi:hypothetical protein